MWNTHKSRSVISECAKQHDTYNILLDGICQLSQTHVILSFIHIGLQNPQRPETQPFIQLWQRLLLELYPTNKKLSRAVVSLSMWYYFFPPKRSHWHSTLKSGLERWGEMEGRVLGWRQGSWGGWNQRWGCRVSRAQCKQLRGVISQAGSPLSGGWLGRAGGAGEAQASKGHQQVGGLRRGGRVRWIDKTGRRGLIWTQSTGSTWRRMVHRRERREEGKVQKQLREGWGNRNGWQRLAV